MNLWAKIIQARSKTTANNGLKKIRIIEK